MPGRDSREHWDDEEAAERRYSGSHDERRAADRRDWIERGFGERYEGPPDGAPPRHHARHQLSGGPRIGPTGMMNHSPAGNFGSSGRYFEDEAGRASYGGWSGGEPSYRSEGPREGYGDPGRRAAYRTDHGYTREDEEAIGGPYADYGHAMGGYGAGGGYTPTPDEGIARERRSWDERSAPGAWFGRAPADSWRDRRAFEGPHRGRGPKGYTRSGERIREDVSDRLTDDTHLDASDIEVAVEGAEVTLNGFVDSRTAKRRAEDHADDVTGVTHVQNNLRVRPRPGTVAAVSDPRLVAIAEGRDPAKAAREAAEDDRSAHPPR